MTESQCGKVFAGAGADQDITPRASANTVPADGSRRDILVGIARGALAGAAVAIGSDVAAQPSPAPLPRVTEAVTPFRVAPSSAAISDARRRLQATRWPERQTADDWRQGAPLATIRRWSRTGVPPMIGAVSSDV